MAIPERPAEWIMEKRVSRAKSSTPVRVQVLGPTSRRHTRVQQLAQIIAAVSQSISAYKRKKSVHTIEVPVRGKIDVETSFGTQSSLSLPLPMLWNDVRPPEQTRVPRVRHSIASQGRVHGHSLLPLYGRTMVLV